MVIPNTHETFPMGTANLSASIAFMMAIDEHDHVAYCIFTKVFPSLLTVRNIQDETVVFGRTSFYSLPCLYNISDNLNASNFIEVCSSSPDS